MQGNNTNRQNWHERADNHEPLVETYREQIPLEKYPKDLDFTKAAGGTTYIVKSHFDQNASECILRIILRWIDNGTDVCEQPL